MQSGLDQLLVQDLDTIVTTAAPLLVLLIEWLSAAVLLLTFVSACVALSSALRRPPRSHGSPRLNPIVTFTDRPPARQRPIRIVLDAFKVDGVPGASAVNRLWRQ